MLPKILYKYRSWNNRYHQKLLNERELFWSKASSFNDPFEFQIPIRYDLLSYDEGYEKYKKALLIQGFSEMSAIQEGRKLADEGLLNNSTHLEEVDKYLRDKLEKYGIVCLAGNQDNILMWSHYGDAHKGICIGLDVEILKTIEPMIVPVNYLEKLPIIIPNNTKNINNNNDNDILQIISSKYEGWKYENEFRLLKYNWADKTLKLDTECFVELVLGSEMSIDQQKEIINTVKNDFPYMKVYKCVRSKFKFSIEIEQII